MPYSVRRPSPSDDGQVLLAADPSLNSQLWSDGLRVTMRSAKASSTLEVTKVANGYVEADVSDSGGRAVVLVVAESKGGNRTARVAIADPNTPQTRLEVDLPPTALTVALSRNGDWLTVVCLDRVLVAQTQQLLEYQAAHWTKSEDPALLRAIKEAQERPIRSLFVTVSDDGKVVAMACNPVGVLVWRTDESARVRTFQNPYGPIECVTISPDSTMVAASCAFDSVAQVWDMEGRTAGRVLHSDWFVGAVAFNEKSDRLITAGSDLTIWEPRSGLRLGVLSDPEDDTCVRSAHFLKDGTIAVKRGSVPLPGQSDLAAVSYWHLSNDFQVVEYVKARSPVSVSASDRKSTVVALWCLAQTQISSGNIASAQHSLEEADSLLAGADGELDEQERSWKRELGYALESLHNRRASPITR